MSTHIWGICLAVLRQTYLGMGRRLTAQWVTISAVAAMQSIFAASLLLAFNLDQLSQQWERGGDILVFLKPGTSPVNCERLAALSQSWSGVKYTHLRTPQDALGELRESLGTDIIASNLGIEVLPATLEIEFEEKVSDAIQLQVRARLLQLEEVEEVEAIVEGHGLLARLYEVREWIALWRWIIGIWVGLSVSFVLSQFVRLNLHQRRREIEVLQSVGASRWFILSPPIIESALQASFGSMCALWIVQSSLISDSSGNEMMSELLQFSPQPLSWEISTLFIMGSMALGSLASWRAAITFLRGQT